MDIVNRIDKLCKDNGTSINALEKKLELGHGSIGKWREKSPKINNIMKISEYFSVSIDYIVYGSRNDTDYKISDEEKRIISSYRRIDNTTKDNICLLLGVKRDIAMEESTVKTA